MHVARHRPDIRRALGRTIGSLTLAATLAAGAIPGAVAVAARPPVPATRAASAGYPALPQPLVGSRPEHLQSAKPPFMANLSVPEVVWPGHDAAALRADQAIDAWVGRQVRAFSAGVATDLAHARNLPASLPESSLRMTFRTTEVDAAVVSIAFTVQAYDRGAASPAQTPGGLSFDMADGRPYTLASLFKTGADYLPSLARESLAMLRAFHPAGARCYVGPGGPPAKAASFHAWSLSASGLMVAFPAGEYTAAYCGPPVLTISARSMRAIAAPGGPLAP